MSGRPENPAAVAEISLLINRILALAPEAGLYIGIKIEPARQTSSKEQKS